MFKKLFNFVRTSFAKSPLESSKFETELQVVEFSNELELTPENYEIFETKSEELMDFVPCCSETPNVTMVSDTTTEPEKKKRGRKKKTEQ